MTGSNSPPSPPSRRSKMLRWARLSLGLLLLLLLLSRVDGREIAELMRKGDARELALGIGLLVLANPVLQVLRLHVLIARYSQRLATSFKLFLVGAFFNLMLPSNVGGDAVKLLYLRRMNAENWAAPFTLLLLHRVTGMVSLLLAAAGYALIEHERFIAMLRRSQVDAHIPLDARLLVVGVVVVAALVLGWRLLSADTRARLTAKLVQFSRDCGSALARVGVARALALLALTVAFHLVRMAAFCVLVAYAGERLAFADSLIVLAATAVAGVIPITVGGLGLMEGAVSVTLLLYGVSAQAGVVVAVANRVVLLLGAGLGGIVNLTFRAPGTDAR